MIYVDELVQWGAPGQYKKGPPAQQQQAERVGARNGHRWCHMFTLQADSEELDAFAGKLGMKRQWRDADHYDLTPGMRAKAIRMGAQAVTTRDYARVRRARKTGVSFVPEVDQRTLAGEQR